MGVARFIRLADEPEVAEVAVTVIDAWQRRGLGTLLLEHLTDQARSQGITPLQRADLEREHAACSRCSAGPAGRSCRPPPAAGVVEYRTALGSAGIGRDLRDALRSAASGRLRLPSAWRPCWARSPTPRTRLGAMCRNIRQLHNFDPPANDEEVHDAALQYVRKISGSTKPSQANEEAFELAVQEVAEATRRLLDGLVTNASPKNRELEAERRRARAAQRFAA